MTRDNKSAIPTLPPFWSGVQVPTAGSESETSARITMHRHPMTRREHQRSYLRVRTFVRRLRLQLFGLRIYSWICKK